MERMNPLLDDPDVRVSVRRGAVTSVTLTHEPSGSTVTAEAGEGEGAIELKERAAGILLDRLAALPDAG